jgi:hypothetical protein
MERVVAVRVDGWLLPILIVTRKENGSHFVRGLLGNRSVYVSYEADGHHHLRDSKAPRTWKDEEYIRIARLMGYRNPERQHGYRGGCSRRQPVAGLKSDEYVCTVSVGDPPAAKAATKYLREPEIFDVADWRPGLGVSVSIYLSETGRVTAAGEQRVIFPGPPATVAVVAAG